MIDFERKIVLVHPPRCGGTSIEETLFDGEYFKYNSFYKHRSQQEYIQIIRARQEDTKTYQWFGLYRNPIDRLKSMLAAGYWDGTFLIPGQRKLNKDRLFTRLQFFSLVKPLLHEGKNLSISDFYDATGSPPITLFRLDELSALAKTIGCQLNHWERSQTKRSISSLEISVIFSRFFDDFQRFHFRIPIKIYFLLPLALVIRIFFKLSLLFLGTLKKARSLTVKKTFCGRDKFTTLK